MSWKEHTNYYAALAGDDSEEDGSEKTSTMTVSPETSSDEGKLGVDTAILGTDTTMDALKIDSTRTTSTITTGHSGTSTPVMDGLTIDTTRTTPSMVTGPSETSTPVKDDSKKDSTRTTSTINTARTNITEASSDNSLQTPKFNIIAVPNERSPEEERDKRTENGQEKYSPYDPESNNFLCGGDFVFDLWGRATTISFFFMGPGNKTLGLTVEHLSEGQRIGSPLYANAASQSFIRIGKVVAFSKKTDSMVFELEPSIKVDLYQIRQSDSTKHTIDLSNATKAMENLRKGKKRDESVIIGRGVQRRGTIGAFLGKWNYPPPKTGHILTGDIDVHSMGTGDDYDGLKEISHESYCGMTMCDNNGDPLSIHHASCEIEITDEDDGDTYTESYSVPLISIMKEHKNYFQQFLPREDLPENDANTLLVTTSSQSRKSRPLPENRKKFFINPQTGLPHGMKTSRGKGGKTYDMSSVVQ